MVFNIPENKDKKRVVIVGGGFGGFTLARRLKNLPVQVVLLDRNNYHTFQPLLYQLATAEVNLDSIAYPLRQTLKKQKNTYFRLAEVSGVNAKDKYIQTNTGKLSYDYLVLATGAKINFFGKEKVRKQSYVLKSIEDALNIRSEIFMKLESLLSEEQEPDKKRLQVTIVGAGPSGVELAGALGEIKQNIVPDEYRDFTKKQLQIRLLEAGPALLPGMCQESSGKALEYLHNLGVKVHLNAPVHNVEYNFIKTDNEKFHTDILIWSAGVKGDPLDGISEKEIVPNNRIKVNSRNQLESDEHIFIIGDLACMETKEFPKGHPMLATVAIQQAKHLAKNLKRSLQHKPMKPFKYKKSGIMATVGVGKAVVDAPGFSLSGRMAYFVWLAVHLFTLLGWRNMLLTCFNWSWSYINGRRSTRFILPSVDA